jgi:hypothetical protein
LQTHFLSATTLPSRRISFLALKLSKNTILFSKALRFKYIPTIRTLPKRTFVLNAFATGDALSKSFALTLSTSLAKSKLLPTFYPRIPSSRRQRSANLCSTNQSSTIGTIEPSLSLIPSFKSILLMQEPFLLIFLTLQLLSSTRGFSRQRISPEQSSDIRASKLQWI